MKILFISFFFPPYKTVASIRTGKTAKLLYEMGHDIKVISAKDSVSEELAIEIPKQNLHQTTWVDIDSYVLKIFGKHDKKNTRNILHSSGKLTFKCIMVKYLFSIYRFLVYTPDKYIGWYNPAIKEAELIFKDWKPDVIYASAMPYTSLIIAAHISKKYSIPFVAELRDLWSDNHYSKQLFFGKWLEKYTLNKASAVVTVSQPLVSKLELKYSIPIYEIRNAFDEVDFPNTNNIESKNNKIIILYTGMMYPKKQDPSLLFDVIANNEFLKSNVVCKFYGNALGWVQDLALEYQISNCVEVYESIERTEVLALQASADILLLLTWNDSQEKGVFTGKLFEYIGSAKPILSIGPTDDVASNVVKDYGFGLASNNKDKIANFIKDIYQPHFIKDILDAYSKYRYLFERKIQVIKLAEIFENVIKQK